MDRSISSETLGKYESFGGRDHMRDFERGKEDGMREFPESIQTEFSQYETNIINEGRSSLNAYMRGMKEKSDQIKRKITKLRNWRDRDHDSQINALTNKKASDLKQLKDSIGPNSYAYKYSEQQKDEAERTLRNEIHDHGRQSKMSMNQPFFERPLLFWFNVYFVILAILAFLEVWINKEAIQFLIEFNPYISLLAAILIGIVLVLFAHFAGIQAKRIPDRTGWSRLASIFFFLCCVAIAGIIVYMLYQLRREQILQTALDEVDLGLAARATNAALGTGAPFTTNPDQGALATLWDFMKNFFAQTTDKSLDAEGQLKVNGLLLLNSIVVLLGTIFSYIRHDPSARMEHACTSLVKRELKFIHAHKIYQDQFNAIEEEYARRRSALLRETEQLDQDIIALEEEEIQNQRQVAADCRMVSNVIMERLGAYQDGNQKARQTPAPSYFGHAGFQKLGDNLNVE